MIFLPTGTVRRVVQIRWLSTKKWQQICGIEAQDWWVWVPGIPSKFAIERRRWWTKTPIYQDNSEDSV